MIFVPPSSSKSSTDGGDGNYRGPKRAVPPSLEDLLSNCLVLRLRLRFYINAILAPPSKSKMLAGKFHQIDAPSNSSPARQVLGRVTCI